MAHNRPPSTAAAYDWSATCLATAGDCQQHLLCHAKAPLKRWRASLNPSRSPGTVGVPNGVLDVLVPEVVLQGALVSGSNRRPPKYALIGVLHRDNPSLRHGLKRRKITLNPIQPDRAPRQARGSNA